MVDEMDDLLTTQEAAERLGVGPTTIKRWADEGRIEAVRTLGGHRRFTVDSVEKLHRLEVGDADAVHVVPEGLARMTSAEIDALPFGIIGFDDDARITVYNRAESDFARVSPERAVGKHLFGELAPCMNNRLVYGRVMAAIRQGEMDLEMDYVFSFKMRPRAVRLRFYRDPSTATNWLVVKQRPSGADAGTLE